MKELFLRLSRHPFITLELTLASLFVNILGLASSLYIIQLLNRYISHGMKSTLFTLTAGVCIAILLEFAFRRVRIILAASVGKQRNFQLMMGSFTILVNGKASALTTVPSHLRREIVKGANTVEDACKPSNLATLFDLPFSFLFVIALFFLSPLLCLITLGFMGITFITAIVSRYVFLPHLKEMTNTSIKGSNLITAADHDLDNVRLFDRTRFMLEQWKKNVLRFLEQRADVSSRQAMLQGITRTIQSLLSVSIYAVGAVLAVKGEIAVGSLIGANVLSSRAIAPISGFAQLGESFIKASQALERIKQLSAVEMEQDGGAALKNYKGGLKLHDLAFGYPGMTQPLFESLSLALMPGAVLVVSGENGTGKTTLFKLISGLLEPDRGQILADGVDIRQMAPDWWYSQLTCLPQTISFLPGTIKENIMTANPKIDDEALNRVIASAGLAPYLDTSPLGMETVLTLNGSDLSSGHCKRLGLARALAVGGKLVLMDEPTEGLDPKGCATVYSLLLSLSRQGHTMIIFSQDRQILNSATRILDLNAKPVPRLIQRPPEPSIKKEPVRV